MYIKSLGGVPLVQIVNCLLEVFSDYFVKMPAEPDYWESRFKAAGVNWNASFGFFEANKLVAFVIHAVDELDGKVLAHNAGTGVLPPFRSRKIVDRLYEHALSFFRKEGVTKCTLEVIQQNSKAIRVYERIGFKTSRGLKCFQGKIIRKDNEEFILENTSVEEIFFRNRNFRKFYSWDHSNHAITRSADLYQAYLVRSGENSEAGYFIVNPVSGYVPQLEITRGNAAVVFNALASISSEVRLNNVDERRTRLINSLLEHGLTNTIDQFEMEMKL